MLERFLDLMHKGGPVMWLLLAMSIVTLTLILERLWFWSRTNGKQQIARVNKIEQLLRQGDVDKAKVLVEDDPSVYGRFIKMLLDEGYSEAIAMAVVESQRPRIERYMSVLSTMITAAPLAGLLGTVTGLISTFRLLSDQMTQTDPRSVGLGLSEALLNTAAGLIVAVVAIFPYNAFRVQVDRTLGRMESILAAASRPGKPAESSATSVGAHSSR
jgi:biopolymer transport protein ExbB